MKKTNRQLQKEQTKAFLLKTAFEVFSKQGIMASRMSDIAQAAGVSHGTPFVHFTNQEEMITSVIELYGSKIALRVHELSVSHDLSTFGTHEPVCTSVRDILAAHLAGIREYEPFYTKLVIEGRLLPPAARDVLVSIQSAISFHLSIAAACEIAAGTIVDIPIHLLFNGWVGLLHYYLANGDLFAPEGNVIDRYGETLLAHYMTLLSPKAST